MDLLTILIWAVILIFSVIASIQDIKEQKVWNLVIYGGILTVFLLNLLLNSKNLSAIVLSALVYGFFYICVKLISKGKFGNADIYFGIFQGICLSVKLLPLCVFLEVILALVILNKRLNRGDFPFIPFMAASLIICNLLRIVI